MRVLWLVWGLAAGLALRAEVAPAQAAAIERLVLEQMANEGIPAVSAAVAIQGSPVWTAAYGFADVENAVPARPESVFRLASVSKPLTALILMSLYDEGKLDLDAPVERYVPEFPEKPWPVTLRQLLAHQGGIRHYQGDEIQSTRHYSGVRQGLAMFAADPLAYEPGTRTQYSSYGYNLAGAAAEGASGQTFESLLRERVLNPAGVSSIQPDHVYRLIPYRVRGYRRSAEGVLMNCGLTDTSNKLPGGGLSGTAAALVQVGNALLEGRLLKEETVRLMSVPVRRKDGSTGSYGLGWGLNRAAGQLYLEHSGGIQGSSTHWIVMPSRRIVIAVLANLEGAQVTSLARSLLGVLLEPQP